MQTVPQSPAAPPAKDSLQPLIDELRGSLQEIISLHLDLLAQCEAETHALRTVEIETVRAIIDRKVALAARTIRLETRREQIVNRLAVCLALPDSPTITRIARALPGHARVDIDQLAARLAEIIARITAVTSRNHGLAQGGVHVASNLLASLSTSEPTSGAYSGLGRVHQSGQRPIIEIAG
jgi:flagellar biosynthesis/type III secretory pathway chaperone